MKKRRTGGGGPNPIKALIDGELEHFGVPPLPLVVARAWLPAVGKRVASRSRPARVRGKTLFVRVTSNAWMTELQMLSPTILKKLREQSGIQGITEVRLELGALPPGPRAVAAPPRRRSDVPPSAKADWPDQVVEALDTIADGELRAQIEHAVSRSIKK